MSVNDFFSKSENPLASILVTYMQPSILLYIQYLSPAPTSFVLHFRLIIKII